MSSKVGSIDDKMFFTMRFFERVDESRWFGASGYQTEKEQPRLRSKLIYVEHLSISSKDWAASEREFHLGVKYWGQIERWRGIDDEADT